jgi:DNA replication licensing factor MCM3
MRAAAQEFLGQSENKKRIRQMIGRGQRLNVNIDEIRQFNPKLSQYIAKKPIEAIKMFEDELNLTVRGM